MAISIPLTGLESNNPVPGNYVEIRFAQGPASAGAGNYSVLLLGNKLSTGSADVDGYVYGPDTNVPMTSEADAIALFGAGSELHEMVKTFLKVNRSTALYAAPVKESVGSKASGVISITGTATASATLRIHVKNDFVDVPVVTGDTASAVAAAAVLLINAKTSWSVVASSNSGDITLEAKQKGLRGNLIRFSARVLNSCGLTVTPTANATALSGGTTADSNANVLDAISGTRYYYIVSAADDVTQLGALGTQIDTLSGPLVGLRQRGIGASVDTIANATSVATAINKARMELVWQPNSDLTPAELASNAAAVYSLYEAGLVPRCNFSGFGNDAVTSQSWLVKAPKSGSSPTQSQQKAALNNGITPIAVGRAGATYLVKRVTTRSLNGSVNDYRIRDSHKVTIADRFADDLAAKQVAQFSGKLIGDDPAQGQRTPGALVTTPKVLKAMVAQLVREYAANDLLENEEQIISGIVTVREAAPNTRLSVRVPLDFIDILDQIGSLVIQND